MSADVETAADTDDDHQSVVESLPEVPDEGVLIKTLFAGLGHVNCSPANKSPSVAGREVCGKVLAVGSKVPETSGLTVGDVIVVYPWPGCGQCETCSADSWQLCDELHDAAAAAGDDDDDVASNNCQHLVADSRFDSFQVVSDWQHVVRLPRELSPQLGCLLPGGALRVYSALLDARHSFQTAVRVRGFANLLVVAGDSVDGLELWAVMLVKDVLCDRNVKVICASGRREVVDRAVQSGADDGVLLPTDTTVAQRVDATTMSGYNRVDVSVDVAGDAASVAVAVRSLHRGGTLYELAAVPAATAAAASARELAARCVTFKPVSAGSLEDLRRLVDVLAVQKPSVDLPVELYVADQLPAAVERLRLRENIGRIVIKYD